MASSLPARMTAVEGTARKTSVFKVGPRTDWINIPISEVRSVLNPLPRLSSRDHDSDASNTAAGGVLETGALVAWRNREGAALCHRLSSGVTAGLMVRA